VTRFSGGIIGRPEQSPNPHLGCHTRANNRQCSDRLAHRVAEKTVPVAIVVDVRDCGGRNVCQPPLGATIPGPLLNGHWNLGPAQGSLTAGRAAFVGTNVRILIVDWRGEAFKARRPDPDASMCFCHSQRGPKGQGLPRALARATGRSMSFSVLERRSGGEPAGKLGAPKDNSRRNRA